MVGQAISHAAQPEQTQLEQTKTVAAKQPTTPHATEQIPPQGENLLNHGGSIRQAAVPATMITPLAKSVSWYNRRWNMRLGAVVTVLVLTCWIAYSRQHEHGYNCSRSEEHTSELQSPDHLVCRLLLEKKKKQNTLNNRNKHHRLYVVQNL